MSLCGLLLGLSLARAQQFTPQDESTRRGRSTAGASSAMYEDIEILRRLLHDKIQAVYAAVPEAQPFQPYQLTPNLTQPINPNTNVPPRRDWPRLPGTGPKDLVDPTTGVPMRFADEVTLNWNGNQQDPNTTWLQPAVQDHNGNPVWLNARNISSESRPTLPYPEGVYLEGHGVVYTVTLPPPPAAPQQSPKAPGKPLTDWDRARKEIRGEKVEAPQRAPARRRTLTEVILRTLAENGHHFTQLPEDESITVVVTFRRPQHAADGSLTLFGLSALAAQHSPIGPLNSAYSLLGAGANNAADPSAPQTANRANNGRAGQSRSHLAPNALAGGYEEGNPPETARDYELLGDLHVKNGRYEEAMRAYRNAAAKDKDPQRLAGLYLKIASLELSAAKNEEAARKTAERALQFLQVLQRVERPQTKNTAQSAPPASGAAAGPAASKLIITAPKRLLDQVATGRIDFEAFRKAVRVQHVPLPTAN
jgi:hypothetical protein